MEHIGIPALQPRADATTFRRTSQESTKSKVASSNSFGSTISSLSSLFSGKSGTSTVHTSRPVSETRDQGFEMPSPHDSLPFSPQQLLEKLKAHDKNVAVEKDEVKLQASDDAEPDVVIAARNSVENALVGASQELSPSGAQQEPVTARSKVSELATSSAIPNPPSPSLPIRHNPHRSSPLLSSIASAHQRILSSYATTPSRRQSTPRHLSIPSRRTSRTSTTLLHLQPPPPRVKAKKPFSKKLRAFFCQSANPDTNSDDEAYRPARVGQPKPHLNYHYRLKDPTSESKRPYSNSDGFPQCAAHVPFSTRPRRSLSTRKSFRPDGAVGSRPDRPRSSQGGLYVDEHGNKGYIPRYAGKGMPAVRIPPRVRSAVDGASKKRTKPRRWRECDPMKRDPARKGGPEPGPRDGDFRQVERLEGPLETASNIKKRIEERKEKGEDDTVKDRLSTASTLEPEHLQKAHVHVQNAAMQERIEKGEKDKTKDKLSTASAIVESRSSANLPPTPEPNKSVLEAGTHYSTRRPNSKAKALMPTNLTGSSSSQKKSRRGRISIPLIRQTITEEDDQMVLYPSCSKVDCGLILEPSEREVLIRRAWERVRKNETGFERAARKLSRGRIDSEIGMCLRECGMEDVLWKCFGAEDGKEAGKKREIGDRETDREGNGTQERKFRPKGSVNMTLLKKRVVMGGRTVDAS